ncbi:RolB family protein [Rhizobium sp. VS19-DR104.2]|uniref:RolB family protein n=1 Tax=unclassified Rhizobium TaxID=2613769 RepID=UPI001C5BC799|nr:MULTISPECIES: RolB family protein [unclassified Rhizobium]MBZ5763554.1 RolB family protein [Rhizobium sp. VS19-DR96]MBZ5769477.1 RolB family protein [Rhizobium sp. VS19-DR129.2]MBZ5777010.1 RolB family protein [Rhizobium sp. VS19-DRK62.2]MBZ5788148.1 RolB family protein [Rhizobium sp. VS19-DR121]MBZ5805603.1 RolB family protein [Rhizobium sp. VS19-DR181]
MAVPRWAVRDLTQILNAQELSLRLEQARNDFRTTVGSVCYFNASIRTPGQSDDEYIMTDQSLTYVYADQATAQRCAMNRLLPSSSSNFGAAATAIPPWLLDPRRLNRLLQEGTDQGGLVNYYEGPHKNAFFLAIMRSNIFVRPGADEINGVSYDFFARGGNYTDGGEDEDEDEDEDEEVQDREFRLGDLVSYPIIAWGSCPRSA